MLQTVDRPRAAVRAVAVAGATALFSTALVGAASAHVTVQPESVEGGGFEVVAFRVPNERDDARTTRLRVTLPADQPIGSVRTTPVPGWQAATRTRTLEEPLEMFGEQVTEVVSQITWTARGGGISPGQFEDFEVSLGPLPESGELVFQALQVYSSGEKVNWNQVAVDESAEPEHPAPVLTVTAPAQADEAAAASDDGKAVRRVAAEPAAGGGAAEGGVPLVLSVLALLLSSGAVVLAWQRRRG